MLLSHYGLLFRSAALTAGLLLLPGTAAPDDKTLDPKVRQALADKYPGEPAVGWCGGNFLGRLRGTAVTLHDPVRKTFRVLWMENSGRIQELQTLPAFGPPSELELRCLEAKQARQLKQTLRHSEAIHDFLRVPAGKGALCYFVEPTQTKCWSMDSKGKLADAGGWQT